MSSRPDGDDDELVDIEIELDGPPPSPDERARAERGVTAPPAPPPTPGGAEGEVEVPEIIELRQPIVEAAETDVRADLALLEGEAAAAEEPGRRAALLVEAARLAELAPGSPAGRSEEALSAARRAFAAAPALAAALWCLRRQLVRGGLWEELAEAYAAAAAAAETAAPPGAPEAAGTAERIAQARADLLVERGRLLEDQLDRDSEAVASYQAALAVAPDHLGALLALLLSAGRRREAPSIAAALEGLARRAEDGTRRAALVIEAARAVRGAGEGAAHALALLETELSRADESSPVGTLLVELEALTEPDAPPEVSARALELVARRAAPLDPAFAVALWRERARLLAREGAAPDAALEALAEAARLDPTHPLVAVSRLELGERLGLADMVDATARELIDAAPSDDQAVDFALVHAGLAHRARREESAAASLGAPRVRGRRAARADLRAFELALAVGRRDGEAVGQALLAEAQLPGSGSGEDPRARADAFTAAGAIAQWVRGDSGAAEELYRRALALVPIHGSALPALVALLGGGDRSPDAADLLEAALEAGATGPLELWARQTLVTIYADEIGQPSRALPHQRRLVGLAPEDVDRRVRLRDVELGGTLGMGEPEAETVLALAERADDPAVAAALRVEVGRGLAAAADPTLRARGADLLEQLASADPTGLAASARERGLSSSEARAAAVTAELAASGADASTEAVRALRFRLAHHHAADGHYAEALAALTPLRSEGDPVARAWSYELARRSGEAILEVAVLSEEIRTADAALGTEAEVLLAHGEALARAGDPTGAAAIFRRALAAAPGGPTAVEAAFALFRLAATESRGGSDALPEALRALAAACADDPDLAAAALREEALARVAAGTVEPNDIEDMGTLGGFPYPPATGSSEQSSLEPTRSMARSTRERAEIAALRFVAGARLGSARAVAESLVDMAFGAGTDGPIPDELAPLLGRAAARARIGGVEVADAVARRIWQAARPPGLATALSDLPVAADGGWPEGRPDTRRARARRSGRTMGVALELEVALDAELRGALGTALAAYGTVIAVDPDRLEAWTGIRRVARAGGDLLGEARALARLGALIRDPERAAGLLAEAASAYERAERRDDAITALAKAVEMRPDDPVLYQRAYDLLRADLDGPGRSMLFDNLLSHRLAVAAIASPARAALLFERAQHRLQRLGDREAGDRDLKQILNIAPEHREALHQLALGAIADGDARASAEWLERFLAAAGDDPRAAQARLDLAAAQEAMRDRPRAVETLRRAAAARPGDPAPLDRLADLQLRAGDWRGAIEALRASEARLPEPRARAALHLRIGAVLRDLGRDPVGASTSFARAAEIDPLGDGTRALVALHDAAGDAGGALATVEREVARLRHALAADPLDARLVGRLAEFLGMARSRGVGAPIVEAEAAVASLLGLFGATGELPPPSSVPAFAPRSAQGLWAELAHPDAGGFIAEIWPNLLEAAAALFPPPAPRERRTALGAAAAGAGLGWIEGAARAIGLPEMALYTSREAGIAPATAIEEPGPGLVLAADAAGAPGLRFHVGRALGLLVQHATILERASADALAPLYACAAVLAGAPTPAGLPEPSEEILRTVTRAVSRKHRKALALQASRFAFESFDLAAWREGVLRTADRLGLLVAGDVAIAATALARVSSSWPAASVAVASPTALVATSSAAIELARFALGDRFPTLRRAASGEPTDPGETARRGR